MLCKWYAHVHAALAAGLPGEIFPHTLVPARNSLYCVGLTVKFLCTIIAILPVVDNPVERGLWYSIPTYTIP